MALRIFICEFPLNPQLRQSVRLSLGMSLMLKKMKSNTQKRVYILKVKTPNLTIVEKKPFI
jgi:hypothetical protein